MVAHNGAHYLPDTLEALAGQTRPAQLYVGVDAGSTDNSAALLRRGLPAGSPVASAPPGAGFGAAVRAGLAELSAPDPAPGTVDWLWLLHDDSAPAPQALEELLLAVERAPSVTIAGTKQVDWHNDRLLVDVGLSISRWAERLTLVDADELDQGQYDGRSDVFAVNSAGMLVRRDVWEALGGFDPALPGSGDDVDLCWRNRLAGNRVVVVPAAKVRHAGSRPNTAASARVSRRAEIFLRLKHAPLWHIPFLAAGAVLGGFGRLFLGMLAKDPGYAFGSLAASIGGVLRPIALYRSRRRAAATRIRPRKAVRSLRARRREVREHHRSLFESSAAPFSEPGAVPAPPQAEPLLPGASSLDPASLEPTGDLHDDFVSLAPARSWTGTGAVAAVLVLLAASLVGLYRLIGASAVAGGALLPLSGSLGDIWSNASGWWIELGSGFPGHGDPFDYVLWLLGAAGIGNTNTAVVILMLTAMPLAGLTAWIAAGALTDRRGLRLWAAVFWGAAPALQVALGEGRLGALIAHILMPLLVLALIRAVGAARSPDRDESRRALGPRPGTGKQHSWAAAGAAGLLLAAVSASAPAIFAVAAVAVLLLSVRLGRQARTLWWALIPSAVLLLPVAVSSLENLRALAADPGLPLGFDAAALWQQFLGFPLAFDIHGSLPLLETAGPWPLVVALVIGAPVLVLSAAALFSGARARFARLAWILSLTALALSWLSAFVATGAAPGELVTPFPGPLVSAAVFLQLCAALLAGDALLRPGRKRKISASGKVRGVRPAAVLLGAVLALGPAAGLVLFSGPLATGTTTAQGIGGALGAEPLVSPAAERTLPATAADRGSSDERTRTLLLQTDDNDDVTAALMRDAGTTLDSLSTVYAARSIRGPVNGEELSSDDAAGADLRRAVAVITAGTGSDPRAELSRLGVGYVVLQESDTSAELLADKMDSVPGLASVGQTGSGWLWRVVGQLDEQGTEALSGQTGRARILAADGSVEAVVPSERTAVRTSIPAGSEGRTLVLAERADPGWQATLDGAPLKAAGEDWTQAWELPAEGGELDIEYATVWEPWVEVAQILFLALTVLLAVPIRAHSGAVRLPGLQGPVRSEPEAPAKAGTVTGEAGESGAAAVEPEPERAVPVGAEEAVSVSAGGGTEKVNASGDSGATEGQR